ncbi:MULTISPECIES: hypothetical protein [Aquimarina]|uniref:hypothetical protein n=1 Tax=Aquimarina TaxID=290174 RepID=UPI0009431887|nr:MULTISPECIES: hypothetical protein [Aquimarina]
MEELFLDLKSRFGQAEINLLDLETIEVYFSKAKEPVIIQKQIELDRFMVSYPELRNHHNGRKEQYTTSENILLAGVIGILNQIKQNGKVLPEF